MIQTLFEYRGFDIRTRKRIGKPLFYAWVYRQDGGAGGFMISDCHSRELVVEIAKRQIDEVLP